MNFLGREKPADYLRLDYPIKPETEIAVISLLASFCEYLSPDYMPSMDEEDEELFAASLSEIEDKIRLCCPEFDEEDIRGLTLNLDVVMNGIGFCDDPPEISPQRMALVEKGHQEFLRRKIEMIEKLNGGNFLGKLICCLLSYEFINCYIDIATKI